MDIGCPNCAATYRVPDAWLASGNPLRCVACGHAWIPGPAAESPVAESSVAAETPVAERFVFSAPEPPDPEPEPPPPPAPPPSLAPAPAPARSLVASHVVPPPLQRRGPPHHPNLRAAAPLGAPTRRGSFLPAAWLASVLLVVIVLLGLVLYRAQLAGTWPPFARVAGLIGG